MHGNLAKVQVEAIAKLSELFPNMQPANVSTTQQVAVILEGIQEEAPNTEDPEALHAGAPVLEGGDEDEWERWVTWPEGSSTALHPSHMDDEEDVGDGGWD